jgi:hypothetical protein
VNSEAAHTPADCGCCLLCRCCGRPAFMAAVCRWRLAVRQFLATRAAAWYRAQPRQQQRPAGQGQQPPWAQPVDATALAIEACYIWWGWWRCNARLMLLFLAALFCLAARRTRLGTTTRSDRVPQQPLARAPSSLTPGVPFAGTCFIPHQCSQNVITSHALHGCHKMSSSR